MTFNCTAQKPERFYQDPVVRPERCDLVVETGFDSDGLTIFTYYLSVHTYFNTAEEMPEFGFGMVVVNNSTGQQYHTYRALEAGQVIPRADRVHVTALLHLYAARVDCCHDAAAVPDGNIRSRSAGKSPRKIPTIMPHILHPRVPGCAFDHCLG